MLENFKTVYKETESEIIEKKSRFIAQVKPVVSEQEALAFIESKKKTHHNASHNCFAYQIGERHNIQRASDDGEPSGTAGMPILDVLKGEDLHDLVVVVTRYFGGTLLGTGGLTRAYGGAAKEAVQKSGIIEKRLSSLISVKTDYHLLGKVQYEILNNGHILQDTVYTADVEFSVIVDKQHENAFINAICEITSAKAEVNILKHLYCALTENGLKMYNI